MPFKKLCCCPQHAEWGHGDASLKQLFNTTYNEEKFCGTGKWSSSGHKERKRKICSPCRDRIQLQRRCETLEAAIDAQQEQSQLCDDDQNLQHVHMEIAADEFPLDTADLPQDKACQFPEQTNLRFSYESLQDRRKRDLRNEILNKIENLVENYTSQGEVGTHAIMRDIIQCKRFQSNYKDLLQKPSGTGNDDKVLRSLAKDYMESKDQETSKLIRAQKAKVSQKLLIGRSLKESKLEVNGVETQGMNSRTEVAKVIGRVSKCGDERRRLLSIVAWDFSQSVLQSYFKCSKSTITAARVHATLFGRGGVPQDGLCFTRQAVSPEIIQEFEEFLHQDDISRPSSCRSVLVDGKETGVRYWQCDIKDVVQQYQLKFPNGVKRSYIYAHIPKNFRSNSMLAGLCNLCDDFGHSNFDSLLSLLDDLKNEGVLNTSHPQLVEECRDYQKFLKMKFSKQVERHSTCAELCLDYALGDCQAEHDHLSPDIEKFRDLRKQVDEAVERVGDQQRKALLSEALKEIVSNHELYLAHLIRTKHQGGYYQYILDNLAPGEIVVIIDYKMKVELGMRARENQREWYGKRGISLHGFFVIAQVEEGQRTIEVIDLWSEDTKQDAWFTQSALDIGFKWLESVYPGFSVYLFSDNGPHYHNSGVLFYLAEVNSVFNFTLKEYNNFEAGEGKSRLDSHFAHISHKIVRWVRFGNDLESGEQIADLIKTMKNASCKKLTIDRSKAKKVGTLKDISLYGNFTFPVGGAFSGGVILRSLAGIGQTVSKSKVQLSQLSGRQLPIAGATGATVTDDEPAPEPRCQSPFSGSSDETYAVRFIQHAPEQPVVATLLPLEVNQSSLQRPEMGYALKHHTGKRTTFSQAQKDIMIAFYNRQAINRIRAEPNDVMKAMREAGLEVLSATQIQRWWSSYHRKNKQTPAQGTVPSSATPTSVPAAVASTNDATATTSARVSPVAVTPPSVSTATASTNVQPTVTPLASVPLSTSSASVPLATLSASVLPPTSSANVQHATPSASVPPSTSSASVPLATLSASVPPPTSSANVQHATPSASVPTSTSLASVPHAAPSASVPPSFLPTSVTPHTSASVQHATPSASVPPATSSASASVRGSLSQFNNMVIEWSFPEDFSQSTIGGRNGSNACAFICLYFGQVASKGLLAPNQGLSLSNDWREVLEWAITSGNDLHDELFDHEGVNVNVDEAVEIAGEECGVACLGHQKDLFGSPKQLLADWLNSLALKSQRTCHLFFSSGRTMFLMCDSSGNLYFVDSHSHRNSGALIASAPSGNEKAFADWIDKMMSFHWQCPLTIGSMTEVIYS